MQLMQTHILTTEFLCWIILELQPVEYMYITTYLYFICTDVTTTFYMYKCTTTFYMYRCMTHADIFKTTELAE